MAITVFSEEELQSLCQEMGNPEWAKEERFSTFAKRKENEEELDRLIGEWTKNFSPQELMNKLQQAVSPLEWCKRVKTYITTPNSSTDDISGK